MTDSRAESARVEALVGDGSLPSEFDRVNWGAVLFDYAWAFTHEAWGWFAAIVVVWFAQGVFFHYFYMMSISRSVLVLSAAFVASTVVSRGLSIALGLRANRLVWDRAKRWASANASARRVTVADYRVRELGWVVIGALLVVAGYGGALYLVFTTAKHQNQLVPLIAEFVVEAALLVALWLYDSARASRAATAPS